MKPVTKTTEEEVMVELDGYALIYNREQKTIMLSSDNTPYAVFTKLMKEIRRALSKLSFSLDEYE